MAYLLFDFIIRLSNGRRDALDSETRERTRREWEKEIKGHEAVRRAWNVELANHETIRAGWEIELADHETIRLGWEIERQEITDMREQLVRDKEQWARDREEEKREEERRKREETREEERHKREETREEERRKREEEDRIRAGFAWDGLQGDHRCLQHGTRRYTARLANVPREYDPVKACTEMAMEIHGVKISSPNQCEDRGCSGVFGHWIVNYSEPACATHFDNFKDKGCTSPGSGRRRIESHLENLQNGDDWRDMCSTTPANFRHLHFDGPQVCEDWGKYGIWGIWEIEDAEC